MVEFLQANWKDIIIWTFVVNGVWNGLIAFLKVMGYGQLAAWCQNLEEAIGAAIQAFKNTPRPPTAGVRMAVVLFVALMGSQAFADMVPGAKSGVIYSIQTGQTIEVNTIKVATIKMVDINAGMARTDGVAVTASIDLSTVKATWLKLPVLDLANYINLGLGCAKESGDKHIPCGPYASVSWKF